MHTALALEQLGAREPDSGLVHVVSRYPEGEPQQIYI